MFEKHARKGRLVYVAGKLQTRKWRKDGEDSRTGSRPRSSSSPAAGCSSWTSTPANGNGAPPSNGEATPPATTGPDDMSDEIPF